jgi:acetyl esterase
MNWSRIIQGKVIYKTVDVIDLYIHVFEPAVRLPIATSAIVFFFGGGWRDGTPAQFFEHSRYLASRGMVAFSAEYRVKNRHDVSPRACVADCKSTIRWVRGHATEYGLDSHRIAAGGGSAGGHIAACAALIPGFESDEEDTSISSVPDALVLFNPVLDTSVPRFVERFTGDSQALSPQAYVRPGLPPTIIFHGKADASFPYPKAEKFTASMIEAGNRCELIGLSGKTHGFFNYGRDDGSAYYETISRMDAFLVSLDFLEQEPV